jgi:indole-3-glycerol phosphate synthase
MFLDKIVATKKEEIEALKLRFSLAAAEKQISELPQCYGFTRAISTGRKRETGLIAEVKKASPSKGLIREDFNPVDLAKAYERAGADCISVLTDELYFQGSNAYLSDIRQQVKVPILRKDFTIDFRQIYEARLIGADAILLIAAILTTDQMREYLQISREIGLDALVEVHDHEELARVLELDAALIGINNRNLQTFVTDLKTTEKLINMIPSGKTIVSESGIAHAEEVQYLRQVGADAVLIGETFMRNANVEHAVEEMMGMYTTKEES